MSDNDNSSAIKVQVDEVFAVEKSIDNRLQELLGPKKFNEFVSFQKQATEKISETWEAVKAAMIANNVKSIKGDFGSISIVERTSFKVNESELDDDYFKKQPDLKKIGSAYALLGEPPAGVTPHVTKFLTKRLK